MWIWCDDFEKDRLRSYFEYGSPDGDFVRLPGVEARIDDLNWQGAYTD